MKNVPSPVVVGYVKWKFIVKIVQMRKFLQNFVIPKWKRKFKHTHATLNLVVRFFFYFEWIIFNLITLVTKKRAKTSL